MNTRRFVTVPVAALAVFLFAPRADATCHGTKVRVNTRNVAVAVAPTTTRVRHIDVVRANRQARIAARQAPASFVAVKTDHVALNVDTTSAVRTKEVTRVRKVTKSVPAIQEEQPSPGPDAEQAPPFNPPAPNPSPSPTDSGNRRTYRFDAIEYVPQTVTYEVTEELVDDPVGESSDVVLLTARQGFFARRRQRHHHHVQPPANLTLVPVGAFDSCCN